MTYYGKEMPTIHPEGCKSMTWEDAELMEKRNEECGWGFSMPKCLHFIANHMEANHTMALPIVTDDDKQRYYNARGEQEKIEWRLTDANFHTLCKLLHDGDYKSATEWVLKEVA